MTQPAIVNLPPANQLLLYSGGLDSFVAWHLLDRPRTAYVRLGHPYELDELGTIDQLLRRYPNDAPAPHILEGPTLATPLEEADGHIPHRNLALLLTASAWFPHVDTIYLVATAGESSPDKSARFLRRASAALTASEGRPVNVVAPFAHLTKAELLATYLEEIAHVPLPPILPEVEREQPGSLLVSALYDTRSCYGHDVGPYGCERCLACFRRWVALRRNGLLAAEHKPPEPFARQLLDRDWRTAWRYLRRTPISEWPSIARLNSEARQEVVAWRG